MKYFIYVLFMGFSLLSIAQQPCASQYLYEKKLAASTILKERHDIAEQQVANLISLQQQQNPKIGQTTSNKTNAVVVIPVVVHVVYNTPTQNISDEQIRDQIRVLNQDYRLSNPDSLPSSHPFWSITADATFEFCLASVDPSGNPTNGITRTFSTNAIYVVDSNSEDVKTTITGGHDNWNPNLYLNIWVCNLGRGVLGYSSFPDQLSSDPVGDGIVVGYRYIGTGGTTVAPTLYGRTLTHEIGHWLGLYHPCDGPCSSDLVSDTPPCESLSYGCPVFPQRANNTCGSDAKGEMFMNFMDYVDDGCMHAFTFGQAARMHTFQNLYRSAIITANKCTSTAGIENNELLRFTLYPNPSNEFVDVYFGNTQNLTNPQLEISDALGRVIAHYALLNNSSIAINTSAYPNGSYIIVLRDQDLKTSKRFTVLH